MHLRRFVFIPASSTPPGYVIIRGSVSLLAGGAFLAARAAAGLA
jgi:hypothetical protein